MLTFDAETHSYFWNKNRVAGVTSILGEFVTYGTYYISTFTGARIPAEAMEKARDFGIAAHQMIALDIAGELDEDALDPKLAAVLKNWQQLRGMIRPEIIMSETPLYCSAHGYAGTSDIIFKLRGVLSVCDFKTGLYGTAAHRMIALDIAGELDEDALDPKLAAVLKNWHQLRGMIRPEIIMSETPLYCSAHGYAGTPDIVCKIKGVLSIYDLKTGLLGHCAAQLAAYEVPVREKLKTRARFDRYGLSLPKDGRGFNLVKYSDRNDWGFFMARLFQHRYLRG
ncbi:MAG: hypothetical protein ABIE47_16840, partial [Pseudomonadota bacterium]